MQLCAKDDFATSGKSFKGIRGFIKNLFMEKSRPPSKGLAIFKME